MRKYLPLILVLLMICATLNAVDEEGTITGTQENPGNMSLSPAFQIKAYRMKAEPALNIVVTSALSNNLDRVNGQTLHIDENYIEQLMGTEGGQDKDMTVFDEHIVFSYRVEGSQSGTFTIALTFEPFYQYVNSVKQNDEVIYCAYEIDRDTYVFNNPSSATDYAIAETNSSSTENRIYFDENSASSTASLSRSWSVTPSSTSAVPAWSVRGAIALDISPTSFEAAAYGTYRSEVKLELTIQ